MTGLYRIWEVLLAGGPVMAPLVFVSVWMWLLILKKYFWLRRVNRAGAELGSERIIIGNVKVLHTHTEEPRLKALQHFLSKNPARGPSSGYLWEASVRRQLPELDRYLGAAMMLALISPMLGLLGTVAGMVDAFEVIGRIGLVNPHNLAAGVRQALISTQAGLLVAIPGLLAVQALKRRVRNIQNKLMAFHHDVERQLREGLKYAEA